MSSGMRRSLPPERDLLDNRSWSSAEAAGMLKLKRSVRDSARLLVNHRILVLRQTTMCCRRGEVQTVGWKCPLYPFQNHEDLATQTSKTSILAVRRRPVGRSRSSARVWRGDKRMSLMLDEAGGRIGGTSGGALRRTRSGRSEVRCGEALHARVRCRCHACPRGIILILRIR